MTSLRNSMPSPSDSSDDAEPIDSPRDPDTDPLEQAARDPHGDDGPLLDVGVDEHSVLRLLVGALCA